MCVFFVFIIYTETYVHTSLPIEYSIDSIAFAMFAHTQHTILLYSGDAVAIDPSASIFVNVKSNDATLDSFVHVDPANQDPPEQPIVLESAEPQAPLEPVVKIITGPKGKSDG